MDDQSHALVELKLPDEEDRSIQPGRPLKRGRKWTSDEDRVLKFFAGEKPMRFLLQKLSWRTEAQLRARMRVLQIKPWQGTYTLREAMRETGYTRRQLLRARDGLGQIWLGQLRKHRTPGRSGMPYRISGEQLDALIGYLGGEEPTFVSRCGQEQYRWSREHPKCRLCGKAGSSPQERHWSGGLCRRCYYEPKCPDCGVPIWTLRRFVNRLHKLRWHRKARAKLVAARSDKR